MPLVFPDISSMGSKASPVIQAFTQINRKDVIGDQEISDGKNLSSNEYPALTCRFPREVVRTISNPQALFAANGKLITVSGTNFQYDGVTKGQVSAGAKCMVDFNDKVLIFPDKKYYDYKTGTFGNIGGGAYPSPGSCPDIDYACTYMNRVFGVKGNNIYATTLGEFDDWTTFNGDNLDAYAVDNADPGSFIGIIAYQQHAVMWKPDKMLENYGAYPAQYQQQVVCDIGCIDNKSAVEVNNRLYFQGREGTYEYGGGLPRLISDNLNEKFVKATAATDGRRYYLSGQRSDGSCKLYVYDTSKGAWIPEDDLQVIDFARIADDLYALAADGKIYKFNSGSELINWGFTTKNFDDGLMGNKQIMGLTLQADLETGSTMSIYVRTDNKDFSLVKSINNSKFKNHKAVFKARKGQKYQFKVEVHGSGKIYGFRRDFVVGGDI